MEISNKLHNY